MYIPEGFKTNKFKAVRIPSKSEYFNTGRFQQVPQVYGGEDPVAVREPSKVETMQALEHDIENYKPEEE